MAQSKCIDSFFSPTPKGAKVPRPESYTRAVHTAAWEKLNCSQRRFPDYAEKRRMHPSFQHWNDDYGWVGSLYAKVHRTAPKLCIKKDFDALWKAEVKKGAPKERPSRVEALRQRLISPPFPFFCGTTYFKTNNHGSTAPYMGLACVDVRALHMHGVAKASEGWVT